MKFESIEIDGRDAWKTEDGIILPRIMGGDDGGAAPAATSDGGSEPIAGPANLDADLDPAPVDPPPADPAPVVVEEPIVQIGDETFTASQVEAALNIQKNQASFTEKNQAEAERLNILADTIEKYRQGPINPTVEAPQSDVLSPDDAIKFQEALLSDNPREAITQLVSFIKDTVSAKTDEQKAESAFMTAHPDYGEVINSPEYRAFKTASPLGNYLNDVNGYYEFKASSAGTALDAATAAGVKQGETQANANAVAKAGLTVLNAGGGVQQPARTAITPETSHVDVLNLATEALNKSRQNE